MPDPIRRNLLQLTALGGLGAVLPRTARASSEPVERRVARIRADWERHRRGLHDRFTGASASPAEPIADDLAWGLPAFEAFKGLDGLSPDQQLRPDVQHLLRDLAGAVGRWVDATVALLAGVDDALDDDLEEADLRAGVRQFREESRGFDIGGLGRAQLQHGAGVWLDDATPGATRRRLRKELRRYRKLQRLSGEMAASDVPVGALEPTDPALVALAPRKPPGLKGLYEDYTPIEVTGMVVFGLVVLGGGVLVITSSCVFSCELSMAALIGGAALLVAGDTGAFAIHAVVRRRRARALLGAALGRDPDGLKGDLRRIAGPGDWRLLGRRRPGFSLRQELTLGVRAACVAVGTLRVAGERVSADGAATPAGPGAPLPEAPLGGLVCTVGSQMVFVGAGGVLPPGAAGPISLSVNAAPGRIGLWSFGLGVWLYGHPV